MSKWIESPLAELANIVSGGTPSRDVPGYWGGEIPWVTPTDITACRTNYLEQTENTISKQGLLGSSTKLLPAGAILLTSRASIGLSKIARIPVSTNQGFKSLIPKQGIDGTFLFYQTQRLRGAFERFAAGSTFLEINKKDTERILLPHPTDPVEQKKIATILNCIDTAIEKTEALIAKYQQIKAGLMHDLFTRGVLPNGQLRPPREQAPELYHETEVGWISKDWQPVSLRDLVGSGNIINGPFGSDLLTSELKTEGVPVLYVQDIKPGLFSRISRAHVTDQKANELAFCNVRQGDVLVAKVGDPPCDTCVYEQDQRAVVTQDVIRIRPTTNVDSLYLASMLNSPFGRKAVKRISIEGTRERVSLTEFKGLTFPIAPTDEQVLIAQRMSAVHSTIASETAKLGKLTRQKRGLMHDLLTGAVPVNVEAPEAVDG